MSSLLLLLLLDALYDCPSEHPPVGLNRGSDHNPKSTAATTTTTTTTTPADKDIDKNGYENKFPSAIDVEVVNRSPHDRTRFDDTRAFTVTARFINHSKDGTNKDSVYRRRTWRTDGWKYGTPTICDRFISCIQYSLISIFLSAACLRNHSNAFTRDGHDEYAKKKTNPIFASNLVGSDIGSVGFSAEEYKRRYCERLRLLSHI